MPTNNSVNARFPDTPDGSMSLGSASVAQTITIGNTTGATSMALRYGTDGYILESAGGNEMVADSNGHVTRPRQPAFLLQKTVQSLNVTGDGWLVTMVGATERFDQSGDFDHINGRFTAPVTGIYMFCIMWQFDQISTAMTAANVYVNTSNREYVFRINAAAIETGDTYGKACFWQTVLADMDPGDTARTQMRIYNGDKQADLRNSTPAINFFAGALVA